MTSTPEISRKLVMTTEESADLSTGHAPTSASIHAAKDGVAQILTHVMDRAGRDPFFRESLIADPEITLNSILSKLSAGTRSLPDFVSVRILEDTETVMNLVIPSPSNDFMSEQRDPSTLLAVLTEASTNSALAEKLTSDPRGTLEQELSARTGQEIQLDSNLDIRVTSAMPGQLVISLPPRTPTNVLWSPTDEALYSQDSLTPMAASTNVDTCRYTTDYCQTSFTNCGNGCGTSGCWTQTYECRR